ncbi:MAG: Acyl-CoA synthetase [Ilumatobacteraceae bacterium]|nr:Acyl-CoA synthetase [Ilumatobacteraceae bacterium]
MPIFESDRPAVVVPSTSETITHRELGDRSRAIARLLHDHGLRAGDHIAILLGNTHHYFEVAWAAQRSGLYYTPVNWHLTADEAAYIVRDCGARVLFSCCSLADLAGSVASTLQPDVRLFSVDESFGAFETLLDLIDATSGDPAAPEMEGAAMFYSSGTTGRPKGIVRPLSGQPFPTSGSLAGLMQRLYRFDADSIYLSPAPLYHAAPLAWSMETQRLGGTSIVMESFDPQRALDLIRDHRVTNAQFVPTMFVRMLKLPSTVRVAADVSSLRVAVHAAAPCPVDVKRAMIDWWGPIIDEFYAGSEGNGFCAISSKNWLDHPGSVGRPLLGSVHIVDDDGDNVDVGSVGTVYFEGGGDFEYHNDPAKTADSHDRHGWSTLGDVGYVDADDYLYLTDRKSHMIIAGGVNIYPQEIEDVLTMHPTVADVAVIGVANADLGEEVKAVIQLADGQHPSEALADELIDYCHARLARFKCPRTIDFVDELPRLPTGKLAKRLLIDRYASGDGHWATVTKREEAQSS